MAAEQAAAAVLMVDEVQAHLLAGALLQAMDVAEVLLQVMAAGKIPQEERAAAAAMVGAVMAEEVAVVQMAGIVQAEEGDSNIEKQFIVYTKIQT